MSDYQTMMGMQAPPADFSLTGYPGMGYTPVPQTFTPESKPNWMLTPKTAGIGSAGKGIPQMQGQSWFDMPTWGMDAVTGKPLGQEDLQPQPPAQVQQEQQVAGPQETPMSRLLDIFLAGKGSPFFNGGRSGVPGLGGASLRAIDQGIGSGALPEGYRVPYRNQVGAGWSGPNFNS